jgi:hypothetical protein
MSQQYRSALVVTNRQASKLKNHSASEFYHKVLAPLNNRGVEHNILDRPTTSDLDLNIKKDSLLVVCGGDGTVTKIANYLLDRELSNTMLPLPFGGANDISMGLYNNSCLNDILNTGSPDNAYTIEAIIEKENTRQRIIRALGYIGIGASGQAAKAINNYQGIGSTEPGAILRATYAALTSGPFTYLDSDNISKRAIEITAIKKRMGRYLESSDTIYKQEFTSIKAEGKLHMLGKFCIGLLGKLDSIGIRENQTSSIQVLSPTALQSDGENIDIEPGTNITFRTGPPISLLRVS